MWFYRPIDRQGKTTNRKSDIKKKLLGLLNSYKAFCKGKTNRSANQKNKDAKFKHLLCEVFPAEGVNVDRRAPKKMKTKKNENASISYNDESSSDGKTDEPSDKDDASFVPNSELRNPPTERLRRWNLK